MTARGARGPRALRRGLFVVLEGLDGAGTTTQLERLARALRQQGHRVHTTCEPSHGPVGGLIRQALKGRSVQPGGAPIAHETLALLFAADRLDHVQSEILPALARGTHVICDRYILSSLAYQGSMVPLAWVATLNERALVPDLTVLVDVDVATAARRRAARGGQAELYEVDSHQRRVAAQYRKAIALRKGREPIVIIDGTRAPEAVTEEALEILRPYLARKPKALAT
jgi:dTMP kinase